MIIVIIQKIWLLIFKFINVFISFSVTVSFFKNVPLSVCLSIQKFKGNREFLVSIFASYLGGLLVDKIDFTFYFR